MTPVSGVRVSAVRVPDGAFDGTAFTSADGSYTITVSHLTGGSYIVSTYKAGYMDRHYNNVRDTGRATWVPALTTQPATNINFRIPRAARLSGRVFEADGVTPVAGAEVRLIETGVDMNSGFYYFRFADTDGSFDFEEVEPESYHLYAVSGMRYVYHDQRLNRSGGTVFTLPNGGSITGVSLRFSAPGSISGRVYAADGVTPLEGATVWVYLKDGAAFTLIGTTTSGEDGAYTFETPGGGTYVAFARLTGYADQMYREHPGSNLASGDVIPVTGGADTPGIDFTLAPTATTSTLTLTLTLPGTRPTKPNIAWQTLARVIVKPTSGGAAVVNGTYSTDDNGQIVLPGLPPGTYTVWVKGFNTLSAASTHTLTVGANSVTTGLLRGGDASGDNAVTLSDFTILSSTFGRAANMPGFDARADFNNDGAVNVADFSLLSASFGMSGTPAP